MVRRGFLLLLFCLFLTGCEFVNPIAPLIQIGVYWLEGEAHKYYATEQSKICDAVKAVLDEFSLPILHEEQKGETIYIRAGDDDRFKIKVTAVRENVTKLSIRINTFGDKAYAEMIYRHVDQQPLVEQFASVDELNTAMEEQPRRRLLKRQL